MASRPSTRRQTSNIANPAISKVKTAGAAQAVVASPTAKARKTPLPRPGAKSNSVHMKKATIRSKGTNSEADTTLTGPDENKSRSSTPCAASMIPPESPPQPPLPNIGLAPAAPPPVCPSNISSVETLTANVDNMVIDPTLLAASKPTTTQKSKSGGRRKRSADTMEGDDEQDAVARELQELREKLAKFEEAARKGEKTGSGPIALGLVPRPGGVGKAGWSLLEAMGLNKDSSNDKAFYNEIMSEVRRCAAEAGIDANRHIADQDIDRLGQAYEAARTLYPFLNQFENDWVTYEFIKQSLVNQRKYRKRRGIARMAVPAHAISHAPPTASSSADAWVAKRARHSL